MKFRCTAKALSRTRQCSRQDVSALSEEIEWDHICEYHAEHRKIDTKYADDTKTIVTQTTWIWDQFCEICGKTKPKTPKDEFITIRSNYSYDLIMGYKFVEEGDVVQNDCLLVTGWTIFQWIEKKNHCLFE